MTKHNIILFDELMELPVGLEYRVEGETFAYEISKIVEKEKFKRIVLKFLLLTLTKYTMPSQILVPRSSIYFHVEEILESSSDY